MIERDYSATNKKISYIDMPLSGKIGDDNIIPSIHDSTAISQAIHMWLYTNAGNKINSISGANLTNYIGKELSLDKAEVIKNALEISLTNDFGTVLTIDSITVVPDIANELYLINIQATDTVENIGINAIDYFQV